MSKALYRKYRSKTLDDVVGQEHITDVLRRALTVGRISHAYLFTGPRGVGKTSVARILAHEINQLPYNEEENHLDIIEIDAASNNSVEDIRDLREKARLAPVSAQKKIYIIDEVHMLSKPAFNALLKTLEEPPEHVVFILATTNVEKLPATIISRTQQFQFKTIPMNAAVKHLRHIADLENIVISDEALAVIAKRGEGSFRDSISLLDQLSNLAVGKEGITASIIDEMLGLAPESVVKKLLVATEKRRLLDIATLLQSCEDSGMSPVVLTMQLIDTLQQTIISKPQFIPLLDALLDVSKSTQPYVKLLTTLALAMPEPKVKSAALLATTMEVSATVESLSHIDEQPPTTSHQFTWDAFIAYTRLHFVAIYSVLCKCSYEIKGTELVIYTLNAFYKKKLDDPKHASLLLESLQAVGGNQLSIHTIPTHPPIKNSQLASVADIMGGGIEVPVE